MKRIPLPLIVSILICGLYVSAQTQNKSMTNADVIAMLDAQLSESTIVLAIQNSSGNFNTTPEALILLKNKGATAKVLDAMLGSPSKKSSTTLQESVITKSKPKVDYKLFTFELLDCNLFGTRLTCELLITNGDRDRWLEIQGNWSDSIFTRIIDGTGKVFQVSNMVFGTNESNQRVRANTVTGVPIKLTTVFDDVPKNTAELRLLEIAVDYDGNNYNNPNRTVQFRNPAVSNLTPPIDHGVQRIFKNEFSFDFLSCEKIEQVVKCIISIKNNGASERRIGMSVADGRDAWMVDSDGKQYTSFEGGFSNNIVRPRAIIGPWESYATIAPGSTTTLSQTFSVSGAITQIKLLRFQIGYRSQYGGTTGEFNIDFRDLPVKVNTQSQFMPNQDGVVLIAVPQVKAVEASKSSIPASIVTTAAKPKSEATLVQSCNFVGDWIYEKPYEGKSYFRIMMAGTNRYKFIPGFEHENKIIWQEDVLMIRNSDGIYLRLLRGKLSARFVSENFRATHGHAMTYILTCSCRKDGKLDYTESMEGEVEKFTATRL